MHGNGDGDSTPGQIFHMTSQGENGMPNGESTGWR